MALYFEGNTQSVSEIDDACVFSLTLNDEAPLFGKPSQ